MKNIEKEELTGNAESHILTIHSEALFHANVERTPQTIREFLGYCFINLGHDPEDFGDKLNDAVLGLSEYCYDTEE